MKKLSALIAMMFTSAVFAQATPATPAKPAEPAKPAAATGTKADSATPATPAAKAEPAAKTDTAMKDEKKKAKKKTVKKDDKKKQAKADAPKAADAPKGRRCAEGRRAQSRRTEDRHAEEVVSSRFRCTRAGLRPRFRFCEARRIVPMKIVVGLSGGVDSAVAALLLKRAGHDVVGLFMKNWEDDDDDRYCSTREDLVDAVSVAEKIGIEIEAVNFAAEYRERVFASFLPSTAPGARPIPT
jgi:hypothetical protein